MGETPGQWTERKPGVWRSADGMVEIEVSEGYPHMGEGPHVKVSEFDPEKGTKGGMRVVDKIFVKE